MNYTKLQQAKKEIQTEQDYKKIMEDLEIEDYTNE